MCYFSVQNEQFSISVFFKRYTAQSHNHNVLRNFHTFLDYQKHGLNTHTPYNCMPKEILCILQCIRIFVAWDIMEWICFIWMKQINIKVLILLLPLSSCHRQPNWWGSKVVNPKQGTPCCQVIVMSNMHSMPLLLISDSSNCEKTISLDTQLVHHYEK